MWLALFFLACLCASGLTIRIAMFLAGRWNMLDHPGGHKQHNASTPFVGGFGIVTVLIGTMSFTELVMPELSTSSGNALLLGAMALFATGLADDIWHLGATSRLAIQSAVAMLMVLLDGVQLLSLGQLLPGVEVELGPWALPFTVFATIGLINAVNMIDGIDGLSGVMSIVILTSVAFAAAMAHRSSDLLLTIALLGGVAGFLYFNLRTPANPKARVFLGDNGSMQLGFLFAWLFIALSQGESRAIPPVTALWFFTVPLLDTVGVMLRRIRLGKSPFSADRSHLHHLFLRAGFRVSDTVWLLALVQTVCAAIGLAGAKFGVPEYMMFWGFVAMSGGYYCVIVQPWRCVNLLRWLSSALRLPSSSVRGIYLGHFRVQDGDEILRILREVLRDMPRQEISFHCADEQSLGGQYGYILVGFGDDDAEVVADVRPIMARLMRCFAPWSSLQVRQLIRRSAENDRRMVGRSGSVRGKASFATRRERRSGGGAIATAGRALAENLLVGQINVNRV